MSEPLGSVKVYIGRWDFGVPLVKLRDLIAPVSIVSVRSAHSHGCLFVTVRDAAAARAVIQKLDGLVVGTRRLKVELARDQTIGRLIERAGSL